MQNKGLDAVMQKLEQRLHREGLREHRVCTIIQLLNQSTHYHEIQYECCATEGNPEIFNFLQSVTRTWWAV
jgi:hypothetical protein